MQAPLPGWPMWTPPARPAGHRNIAFIGLDDDWHRWLAHQAEQCIAGNPTPVPWETPQLLPATSPYTAMGYGTGIIDTAHIGCCSRPSSAAPPDLIHAHAGTPRLNAKPSGH